MRSWTHCARPGGCARPPWPPSRRIAPRATIWCCCRRARISTCRGSDGHLGFERTLCTELAWRAERLDGELRTANRRGAEKLRCLTWLRTQYPGLPIVAYGNSAADLDHLRQADRALLVNGNAAARALAKRWGIPTADWSLNAAAKQMTDSSGLKGTAE